MSYGYGIAPFLLVPLAEFRIRQKMQYSSTTPNFDLSWYVVYRYLSCHIYPISCNAKSERKPEGMKGWRGAKLAQKNWRKTSAFYCLSGTRIPKTNIA